MVQDVMNTEIGYLGFADSESYGEMRVWTRRLELVIGDRNTRVPRCFPRCASFAAPTDH